MSNLPKFPQLDSSWSFKELDGATGKLIAVEGDGIGLLFFRPDHADQIYLINEEVVPKGEDNNGRVD